MSSYQTPGVHVEEVERGPKPIEGVSTSTAGFLGETERGPTEPTLVTSFADFERTYGGYAQYTTDGRLNGTYLAYAVDGFFRNGGKRAYISRVIPTDAVGDDSKVASTTITDSSDNDILTATATGPGTWGHNMVLLTDEATRSGDDLFSLTIKYWPDDDSMPRPSDPPTNNDLIALRDVDPPIVESYDNLSTNRSSSDFYEKRINGVSDLVTVERQGPDRPPMGTDKLPAATAFEDPGELAAVSAGDYEGNNEKGEKTGLEAFKEIDGISIVCAPDQAKDSLSLAGTLNSHCMDDELKDRVAVLQAEQNLELGSAQPPINSSYTAYYAPWIEIQDPVTDRLKQIPPGGHIVGIYARSDADRGVHKAPANEVVRGAQGLEYPITSGEQGVLNPRGINCIRSFRGRGIRVWGARTTSPDPNWKYINVRRLFLYLEESIEEGTQWVVFEPNDEDLWARVRQTVSNFLRTAWEDGALMGSTPEEAFYVKCDRSTMTQNDIDNGRLICEIGVAPVKPAEFVVFRIAQWTGGGNG